MSKRGVRDFDWGACKVNNRGLIRCLSSSLVHFVQCQTEHRWFAKSQHGACRFNNLRCKSLEIGSQLRRKKSRLCPALEIQPLQDRRDMQLNGMRRTEQCIGDFSVRLSFA